MDGLKHPLHSHAHILECRRPSSSEEEDEEEPVDVSHADERMRLYAEGPPKVRGDSYTPFHRAPSLRSPPYELLPPLGGADGAASPLPDTFLSCFPVMTFAYMVPLPSSLRLL